MPPTITLPALEPGAAGATVEHYYKQIGDAIARGESLAVVATDRFEWIVPASADGTIESIAAPPGSTVTIGEPLVELRTSAATDEQRSRPPRVTPLARNIAAAHQLDLADVPGSGHGGAITRADVWDRLQEQRTENREQRTENREQRTENREQKTKIGYAIRNTQYAIRNTQYAIRNTQYAIRNTQYVIPHALTAIEVDLGQVQEYIVAQEPRWSKRGIVGTPIACVAYAAIAALAEHRTINSQWSEDGIILRGRVQLGVQQGDGPLIVVADAADLSVQGLARAIDQVGSDQIPTFTIVAGDQRWGRASIPPTQAAVLSLGAIERRPLVIEHDGSATVAIRPLAILTLTYDARVIDQVVADAFLAALKQRLECWNRL